MSGVPCDYPILMINMRDRNYLCFRKCCASTTKEFERRRMKPGRLRRRHLNYEVNKLFYTLFVICRNNHFVCRQQLFIISFYSNLSYNFIILFINYFWHNLYIFLFSSTYFFQRSHNSAAAHRIDELCYFFTLTLCGRSTHICVQRKSLISRCDNAYMCLEKIL